MNSNLSLPEETVAEAHYGGLRPSSIGNLHLSPKSVLEVYPTWWTLTQRMDRIMEGLHEQLASAALGFTPTMEDINQQIVPATVGVSQLMKDLDQQMKPGVSRFAQAMEDINQQIVPATVGVSQLMKDLNQQTAPGLLQVAQTMEDFHQQMLPSVLAASQAWKEFGEELGLPARIEDLVQQGVLDPEFGARSPVHEPQPSVDLASGVRETELVLSWLSYLRFVAPYIWNWIRDNPGTALWRLFLLANAIVGYQRGQAILNRIEQIEDSGTESQKKVVTQTRIDVRVRPDSSSRVQDSRYVKDASVMNEVGAWTKIEYCDPRDGKTKTGWVLTDSLKKR